jgi:TolB-like protein/DNA-binding winged helix-turn-helix (wHTH) protein/Tfp pilus assembly protein PilF
VPEAKLFYQFGPFRLDPAERLLLREGKAVPLAPKAFDTLLLLVENNGHLLSKDELMKRDWPDTFVEEVNLAQNISAIRRALDDKNGGTRYIETVAKGGYRFTAETRKVDRESPNPKRAAQSPELAADSVPELFRRRRSATRIVLGASAAIVVIASALFLIPRGLRIRARGTTATPGATAIRSIAVLPLVNLSSDPEQEYFADGMTDELITTLAKISQLRVISRTSVMRYRNTQRPIAEIGRELGVEAVIEGTLLRSGNKLRITTQLIEAATDRHLWAEAYERELGDILSVQAEVGRDVAREVQLQLTADERARLTPTRSINPEAYELYLKGRYLWYKLDTKNQLKSVEYFQQAIDKEPQYAAAYAGIAQAYSLMGSYLPPQQELVLKAKNAAHRALELDSNLDEAHLALSEIMLLHDWDWRGAEVEIHRAIELNASNSTAYYWNANLLVMLGRSPEALAQIRKAQLLDPISPLIGTAVGEILLFSGQTDQAQKEIQKALEFEPDFFPGWLYLAWVHEEKRMRAEALEDIRKVYEPDPSVLHLLLVGEVYAQTGSPAKAREILARTIKQSKHDYTPAVFYAMVYAALGEKDRAFSWLEKAYTDRSGILCFYLRSPKFESLRSDPRYADLLRRIGLPAQ